MLISSIESIEMGRKEEKWRGRGVEWKQKVRDIGKWRRGHGEGH
jgi:hypothetical protein